MKPGIIVREQVAVPVIKFNMLDDDKHRSIARQGYSIQRHLKDAGLMYGSIILASKDQGVQKQFKLPPDSDLICLQIDLSGKSEDQKAIILEEIKNCFLILDDLKLVDERSSPKEAVRKLHRFLIKMNPASK